MGIMKLEIAKLEMKPGDVLVVRLPILEYMDNLQDGLDGFQEVLAAAIPNGCTCLILPTEAELSIITPEQGAIAKCN